MGDASNPDDEQADALGRLVWTGLGRRIGLIADVLGALGFYGLVYEALKLISPNRILGVPTWGLAVFFGTICAAGVTYLSIRSAVRQEKLTIKDLRAQLRAALAESPEREMQKRIYEAASRVYGFEITKRRHFYTIYGTDNDDNGSGACKYEFYFKCNRRSLGQWYRTASSSLAPKFGGAIEATMSSPKRTFKVTTSMDVKQFPGQREMREEFKFYPAIQQKHGEVKLEFKDNLSQKTFLTKFPNEPERDRDYVSVSTREPLGLLEMEVVFDGFKPADVWASAIYGPSEQSLPRESVDVTEALDWDERGGQQMARLSITYPVMGVIYRLGWTLTQPLQQLRPPTDASGLKGN